MADPARPALARTLAVLTNAPPQRWDGAWNVVLSPYGASAVDVDHSRMGLHLWAHESPREAEEALSADGVLPQGWGDRERRGWACPDCGGVGKVPPGRDCRTCMGTGEAHKSERTIPDLVAVASLGWAAIQRAEELARAACLALREYGCPTPDRVVWRVGERRDEEPREGEIVRLGWRSVWWKGDVMLGPTDALIVGDTWDGHPPCSELLRMGLALDRITPEAVVVVVPPVGGVG